MKNDNKLIVIKNKVTKNLNDGTKLIVSNITSFSNKNIGPIKGLYIILAVCAIIILFLGFNLFKKDGIDYPIVYNTAEGDLYLMESKAKKEEDAIKLARNEITTNVEYANTKERYILFQKEQKLYLYDAKDKDQTTKIMDNISEFSFSLDDKFIIGLDKEKNLKIYNYKETQEIENDVSRIYLTSKNKIIYEKENKLYVRSINPKKDDRRKITEEFSNSLTFSEDESKIIYINKNSELYSYDIKKDKNTRIAENVYAYYCDSGSCNNLIYIETSDTKTIYYYDGKKNTKIASDIYMVHAANVDEKQVVYSVHENKNYKLYYQVVSKDAALIEDDLSSIRSVRIHDNKDIYYITGKNEVKYINIKGHKLGKLKELASDVTGYLESYKDGYVFVGDVNENSLGTLYIAKNGTSKKIDNNVNCNILTVNKDGNKIYYLKDYKTSGDLYVTSGGKGKKIDDDVYTMEYIKDNLIYYIKDYSTSKSRGDLYRYTGKSLKIAENVTRMANPPVTYNSTK